MNDGQVEELRMEVVRGAQALVAGGVLSGTQHGNWRTWRFLPSTARLSWAV
jgi:hypothetical protein